MAGRGAWFGHTNLLLFNNKKRTFNRHFSRPAVTDPYTGINADVTDVHGRRDERNVKIEFAIAKLST